MSFAVSLFEGELGYSTKSGFVRIPYGEMIEWAKQQGRESPYKRLYTPRNPYRFKKKRRKARQNICGRLRLQSKHRCHIVIREETDLLSEREVRFEADCPKSKRFCPLTPPPKDLDALRNQMESGKEQASEFSSGFFRQQMLTPDHFGLDSVQTDIMALCEWFDLGHGADSLSRMTDEIPDVPLLPPDEPYVVYHPDDFFQKFGFEMKTG